MSKVFYKNVWAAANGLKQKSSVIRSHHDEHWHREVPLTRVREQIWSVLLGKGQVKRSMWTRLAGLPLTTNPVSHLYLCFRSILLSIHRAVRCSSFYSPFISHCNPHTPSPPPPCPSHPFILWILHYSSLSFICNMYPFVQVCSWLCTSLSVSLHTVSFKPERLLSQTKLCLLIRIIVKIISHHNLSNWWC